MFVRRRAAQRVAAPVQHRMVHEHLRPIVGKDRYACAFLLAGGLSSVILPPASATSVFLACSLAAAWLTLTRDSARAPRRMPLMMSIRTALRERSLMPTALRRNHRTIAGSGEADLARILRERFFSDATYFPDPNHLTTPKGDDDLQAHVFGRLDGARSTYVPWLDALRPLAGARVIEIGCGTGASSVALAEQGATVMGLDLHDRSLDVARVRVGLYGLTDSIELRCEDAARLDGAAAAFAPDMVIFFAALEHMTATERLDGIRAAWRVLQPGGLLVVLEAPNRLWHTDTHTALAPFYEWLPDDLAMRYARFTSRPLFKDSFATVDDERHELLARWGRGVSFHEFVVALELPYDQLPVVDSLEEHLDRRLPIRRLRPRRYQELLRRLAPALHRGFTDAYLNIALRKK